MCDLTLRCQVGLFTYTHARFYLIISDSSLTFGLQCAAHRHDAHTDGDNLCHSRLFCHFSQQYIVSQDDNTHSLFCLRLGRSPFFMVAWWSTVGRWNLETKSDVTLLTMTSSASYRAMGMSEWGSFIHGANVDAFSLHTDRCRFFFGCLPTPLHLHCVHTYHYPCELSLSSSVGWPPYSCVRNGGHGAWWMIDNWARRTSDWHRTDGRRPRPSQPIVVHSSSSFSASQPRRNLGPAEWRVSGRR